MWKDQMEVVDTHMLCCSLELVLSNNCSMGLPCNLLQMEEKKRADHIRREVCRGPSQESPPSLLASYYTPFTDETTNVIGMHRYIACISCRSVLSDHASHSPHPCTPIFKLLMITQSSKDTFYSLVLWYRSQCKPTALRVSIIIIQNYRRIQVGE